MNQVEGNLFDFTDGIIAHQVNCQGVMGAGLAKQIADRWPSTLADYQEWCDTVADPLGHMIYSHVGRTRGTVYVAHLFGQRGYGRGRQTHYGALASALGKLRRSNTADALPVYIPHGLGCGLAGGDWDVVSELIETLVPEATVVRLPSGSSK